MGPSTPPTPPSHLSFLPAPACLQAEVHAIIREYLPLGGTDTETAALSESLLRSGNGGSGGGGTPGGRRKNVGRGAPGGPGQPLYAGMAGGGADVEAGGEAPLLPQTPGTGLEGRWWAAVEPPAAQRVHVADTCPTARLSNPSCPCASLARRPAPPPPHTEMTDLPSPSPRRLLP